MISPESNGADSKTRISFLEDVISSDFFDPANFYIRIQVWNLLDYKNTHHILSLYQKYSIKVCHLPSLNWRLYAIIFELISKVIFSVILMLGSVNLSYDLSIA